MASLGKLYGSFTKARDVASLSTDAADVFVYLLVGSANAEVRFSFHKRTTVMDELGWRNLDRIDAAYAELEAAGFIKAGSGHHRLSKKTVDGYYLHPDASGKPVQTPKPVELPQVVTELEHIQQTKEWQGVKMTADMRRYLQDDSLRAQYRGNVDGFLTYYVTEYLEQRNFNNARKLVLEPSNCPTFVKHYRWLSSHVGEDVLVMEAINAANNTNQASIWQNRKEMEGSCTKPLLLAS